MELPQVIFLNGPSSSGKTSLARALQLRLEKPYIHMAEDMFFGALPAREFPELDSYRYGSRLYKGFTQCVRTLVTCENRVIVDTVAWNPGSLAGFVDALWDTQIFAVGVHCPLPVLEAREQQRKDRGIGLARRQLDLVHQDALYDFEIDTASAESDICAALIINAMQSTQTPHAFARMRQQFSNGTG